MNLRFAGLVVGVALVASACGGGSTVAKSAPVAPTPIASPAAPAIQTEGSVPTEDGKFIEWPDGMRVTFVSAVSRPNVKSPYSDRIISNRVRFTFTFQNNGPQAVSITSWQNGFSVYGGADRYSLTEDSGFGSTDPIGTPGKDEATSYGTAPTQLAPGSSYEYHVTYIIPTEYRDSIAIELNRLGGTYTTYTFTDVGKVLS